MSKKLRVALKEIKIIKIIFILMFFCSYVKKLLFLCQKNCVLH